MAVNPDFRELFSALNAAEARYLVVGAYAVIHHTDPRYTKDLDIWVEPRDALRIGWTSSGSSTPSSGGADADQAFTGWCLLT
jgi:hypothetical protein